MHVGLTSIRRHPRTDWVTKADLQGEGVGGRRNVLHTDRQHWYIGVCLHVPNVADRTWVGIVRESARLISYVLAYPIWVEC